MYITWGELRAIAESRELDDDAQIIVASQPLYPKQATVTEAVPAQLLGRDVLVLVEGNQEYMARHLAGQIGWEG